MEEDIRILYKRVRVGHLTPRQRRELIDKYKSQGWQWEGQQAGQYVFSSKVPIQPTQRNKGMLPL